MHQSTLRTRARSNPFAHLVRTSLLVALVLAWTAPGAYARPTSVGPYAEAGLGAAGFLGAGAAYSKPGVGLELRMGYDLFAWLSVGGLIGLSTHEATVPPPPEGEYFQLYSGMADARVSIPVGSFQLFAEGSVGLAAMSSNILAQVGILEPGESISLAVRAGAGFEYQLQNRHYAFGFSGQWMNMLNFENLQGVSTRLYLRYTY